MTTISEWRMWMSGIQFHLDTCVDGLLKMMAEEEKIYKAYMKENPEREQEEAHQEHLLFRRDIRWTGRR